MPQTLKPIPKACFKPIYDHHLSYLDNLQQGPFFDGSYMERQWPVEMDSLLGYPIASPLGVPAGPLLNANWIHCAARLGFDVLTYKTIRSHHFLGHGIPNVLFVDVDRDTDVMVPGEAAHLVNDPQDDITDLSITNSFGNPSMTPEYLQEDIAKARSLLHVGQVLIVSVFGIGDTANEVKEDFVRTAVMAKEAGAHIIEANFSCPNVSSKEGSSLYTDLETSYTIAKSLIEAIHPLPLIIKLGCVQDSGLLRKVLLNLSRAGVHAVCGINTIPMRVVDDSGKSPLGPTRKTSGICGAVIRPYGIDFVKNARAIIKSENLDLDLLACGGVTIPEHFDEYFNAGAHIAMAASGMMWDPYLAMRWHHKQGENHER